MKYLDPGGGGPFISIKSVPRGPYFFKNLDRGVQIRCDSCTTLTTTYISCLPLRLIHKNQCPVVFQWLFLLLQSELGFDRYVEHADVVQSSLATVAVSTDTDLDETHPVGWWLVNVAVSEVPIMRMRACGQLANNYY